MIRLRTLWRLLVRMMAGAFAVAAGFLALGAWIVMSGPVSVGFLKPYIEKSLVFEDTSVHIELGDTVLAWGGWRRNLNLSAIDVRVVQTDGRVVASVPKLSVTLSVAAALRGRLEALRVELLGPELRFQYGEDGRVTLGGLAGGDEQAGSFVQTLLAALSHARSTESPAGYLEVVQITDGLLWLEDRVAGVTWHAPDADAVLKHQGAGVVGNLELELALGDETLRLAVEAEYSGVSGAMTLETVFSGLNPSHFAGANSALAPLGSVNMPVSGTVAALFDLDGTITRVDYDLIATAGELDIPDVWRRPQPFDQITVRGSLTKGFKELQFDEAVVTVGTASGEAAGSLTFGTDGVGLIVDASWKNVPVADFSETWPWRLAPKAREWFVPRAQTGRVLEGTLSMRVDPGRFQNLPLRQGEIDMTFSYEDGAMWILEGHPPVTGVRGHAHHDGATFNVKAEAGRVGTLELRDLTVRVDGLDTSSRSAEVKAVATGSASEFRRLFTLPPLLLEGVSEGVGGNVTARATFAFPLRKGITAEDIEIAAAANIRDLSLENFLGGWQLEGGNFEVRYRSGVSIEAQGPAEVNGLQVEVDFRKVLNGEESPSHVAIAGVLDDAGREVLGLGTDRLIRGVIPFRAEVRGDTSKPSEFILDLDLTPASLSLPISIWDKPAGDPGTARVRVVRREDGTLKVSEFSILSRVIKANGQLTVDLESGVADGDGVLNGIDFKVIWERLIGERASRLVLTGMLDDQTRAAIGYPTGAWVTGPMRMNLVLLAEGLHTQAAKVSLDLKPATVQVPLWDKPPGMDGVAELSLSQGASGRYEVRSFAVSSGGLVASGTIQSGSDGRARQLDVARLVFGETRLGGSSIAWDSTGAYQISLSGECLDLRPLLDELAEIAGEETLPHVELAARFDQVILTDTQVLSALQANGEYQNGTWQQSQAVAALPNGSMVTATLSGGAEAYLIAVTTADAGELFRTFGIFNGAEGGRMDLRGTLIGPPGQKVFDGRVLVDAFRVANAPALAQILSLASLPGLYDVMQGQGITFIGFEAPFKYRDGDVAVGRARAFGPALGITLEGMFSRRTDAVNLAGTLVPAYTINQVLGGIPLLGDLLVGEGVFAIAYRVTGDTNRPTVTVNPLSALTPGFLRGIIFGFQPEMANGIVSPANPNEAVEEMREEAEPEPEPLPPRQ